MQPIVDTVTAANYTLLLTDANRMKYMNSAVGQTVVVPPNSSVAFPTGSQILFTQAGAGQTIIQAGSGVTIHTASFLTLRSQYSGAFLMKVGTDEWVLMGDLTP